MSWNSLVLRRKISSAHRKLSQGGFGLIELMVSISIMAIVSATILVRQDSFNSAILLRGQAFEIALQTREVQMSAVSSSGDIAPGIFRSVLGIHFDSSAANNSRYKIFRDLDGDGYDAGEEYGAQGEIDKRFEISEIRAGVNDYDTLSVVFERPNFDARFFSGAVEVFPTSVEIDIASVNDSLVFRTVEITSTGQITVKSI
ncbi:MAG: prepilin-type N-terminal cleavage/methylation domain-containing protein [Candidatus Paceibacteria bacterium]|jgi:prepilin-type N-terminal cleavage/methylation domain-containing protein